jgi:hypothetical protein
MTTCWAVRALFGVDHGDRFHILSGATTTVAASVGRSATATWVYLGRRTTAAEVRVRVGRACGTAGTPIPDWIPPRGTDAGRRVRIPLFARQKAPEQRERIYRQV